MVQDELVLTMANAQVSIAGELFGYSPISTNSVSFDLYLEPSMFPLLRKLRQFFVCDILQNKARRPTG
jgi:hypothetical protein